MSVKVKERDGAWWIFVHHQGIRKARRVGVGRLGKRAADDAAVLIAARLAAGGPLQLDGVAKVPTFTAVAKAWRPWYRGLYALRESTWQGHEGFLQRHLEPFFGPLPIDACTRPRIQAFIASKRIGDHKLSDASLRTALPTLRLVLDYAVEHGYIPSNPMRGVKLWRPAPRDLVPDPFTQAEADALVAAASEIRPTWGRMVEAWLHAGMRSGELRGLQHQDVDWSHGTALIQRTYSRRRLSAPKTLQSRRAVPLPTSVREAFAGVTALDGTAPLFPSFWNPARMMAEEEMGRLWKRTLARAKVRPRPPETLRHTCISLRLSRGESLLSVAALAGHSPKVLLQHYAKWLPDGGAVGGSTGAVLSISGTAAGS